MNDVSQSSETTRTADQIAVNEYFESTAYQEARRTRHRDYQPHQTNKRWTVALSDLDVSPKLSFILGLAGLNVILLVVGCATPIAMHLTQDFVNRSNGYFFMMAFIQTIILPPIISFSFATVTPMFWYGSVLLRFGVGILLVIPGCLAFYTLINLIDGSPPNDFWFTFSGVMFTQFLTAGTVALVIQMWSPWTLTHLRDESGRLPPLGTRAMLELTGVAAIGCAFFMTDGTDAILEGILFFAGMGGVSSLAVIAVLIAFLRDDRRNLAVAAMAFAASFSMAALLCGFFAIQEFGWSSISGNLLTFTATATYGATVIAGVMWMCVRWLRFCGWRCINRNHEKTLPRPVPQL